MNWRLSVAWTTEFTVKAAKSFRKLDKPVQRRIVEYLRALDDPRAKGKALSANLPGFWHWRVGDYRIIAELNDGNMLILVVAVDHRSRVYE